MVGISVYILWSSFGKCVRACMCVRACARGPQWGRTLYVLIYALLFSPSKILFHVATSLPALVLLTAVQSFIVQIQLGSLNNSHGDGKLASFQTNRLKIILHGCLRNSSEGLQGLQREARERNGTRSLRTHEQYEPE